jgi:hypothetical protein
MSSTSTVARSSKLFPRHDGKRAGDETRRTVLPKKLIVPCSELVGDIKNFLLVAEFTHIWGQHIPDAGKESAYRGTVCNLKFYDTRNLDDIFETEAYVWLDSKDFAAFLQIRTSPGMEGHSFKRSGEKLSLRRALRDLAIHHFKCVPPPKYDGESKDDYAMRTQVLKEAWIIRTSLFKAVKAMVRAARTKVGFYSQQLIASAILHSSNAEKERKRRALEHKVAEQAIETAPAPVARPAKQHTTPPVKTIRWSNDIIATLSTTKIGRLALVIKDVLKPKEMATVNELVGLVTAAGYTFNYADEIKEMRNCLKNFAGLFKCSINMPYKYGLRSNPAINVGK